MDNNLCGILIADKPEGFTSFDVAAVTRKAVGTKRIGHTGTLDPMATGVLPLLIGRATTALVLIENTDKEYVAKIKLGSATDTLDRTGQITAVSDKKTTEAAFCEALKSFCGTIAQIPPMYSAVKQNGKKLYELAREGKTVERESRTVTIYENELLDFDETAQTATIRVFCSKGTYIRTLADDLGKKLGTYAHLEALRRTKACGFDESEAVSIDNIRSGNFSLIPLERLFLSLPIITLDKDGEKLWRNGVRQRFPNLTDGRYRIYTENGFIATGKMSDGELQIEKNFIL
ncbi:MAG: tRNA pseudouridine(55) synthase TruB [Ruminococcus sp.]|jgi:tRNA pseudouridine55 synthase|nr:tRNA pseudouridine(55) synthase TruB [Ruminococcus sp.]